MDHLTSTSTDTATIGTSAGGPGGPLQIRRTLVRQQRFVVGVQDRFGFFLTSGVSEGVQVHLTAVGARRLLGLLLGELGAMTVELGDVLGAAGGRLVDELAGLPGWEARLTWLDAALLRRLADTVPPPLAEAWWLLTAGPPGLPVEAVAARVGWSRKHLSDVMRRELGVTPRRLGRIRRFERVVSALRHQPGVTMAAIAARAGYFDQAQLVHEFHEFAGQTPGAFRRELGIDDPTFLQDDELVGPRDWQHVGAPTVHPEV